MHGNLQQGWCCQKDRSQRCDHSHQQKPRARQGKENRGEWQKSQRDWLEKQTVKQNSRKWEQTVASYFSASSWNRHFYYNIMYSLSNMRTIALYCKYNVLECKETAPFARPHRMLFIEAEITLLHCYYDAAVSLTLQFLLLFITAISLPIWILK